jgi:hypothetical protein
VGRPKRRQIFTEKDRRASFAWLYGLHMKQKPSKGQTNPPAQIQQSRSLATSRNFSLQIARYLRDLADEVEAPARMIDARDRARRFQTKLAK